MTTTYKFCNFGDSTQGLNGDEFVLVGALYMTSKILLFYNFDIFT